MCILSGQVDKPHTLADANTVILCCEIKGLPLCQDHFCLKIRNEAIARDKKTEKLYQHVIFFFQAEDGIRVWSVTGVQTCALPIYYWGALGKVIGFSGFDGVTKPS